MPGKPKRYTPEFKEQAAKRVVDNSLPIAQVARELGVNDTTLGLLGEGVQEKAFRAADPGRTCRITSGSGNSSAVTASLRRK